MKVKIITFLIASALFLFVSACNTVKGVGKDLEKLGSEMQDISDK